MTHRIRRQILELELPREEGALAMAQAASRLFQERVLPRLDVLFSELAPADRVLRIDQLTVDLERLSERDFEQQFVEQCWAQISQQVGQLAKIRPTDSDVTPATLVEAAQHQLEALVFFLECGRLPWSARRTPVQELEAGVTPLLDQEPGRVAATVGSLLSSRPMAIQRVAWQFSFGFASRLVEVFRALPSGSVARLRELLDSLLQHPLTEQQLERLLVAVAQTEHADLATPQADLDTIAPIFLEPTNWQWIAPLLSPQGQAQLSALRPRSAPVDIKDTTTDSSTQRATDEVAQEATATAEQPTLDGLPLDLAGLVLLAPYLSAFFGNLDVRPDSETPASAHRPVHLLHYLATGQELPEESVLVLPKLLCGLPLEAPVPQRLPLTDTERQECDNLLRAIITNWPVLKNTSPDGLRSAFLQRQGLYYDLPDASLHQLKVERQSQDILLERLPWGFSVVKLPWMPRAVNVEW